MFPRGFHFPDNLHARFVETYDMNGGLISVKVRRLMERHPDLDIDELTQIGRCIMMICLQSYDKSRGKAFHVYFGFVLDNVFRDHVAGIYSSTRCPKAWVRDHATNDWMEVSVPAVFTDAHLLDAHEGEDDVEENVETKLRSVKQQKLLDRVRRKLNKRQCLVLDAIVDPPAAALVIAKEEQGNYHFNKTHIAKVLGITPPQMEYAVSQIRHAIDEVADERPVRRHLGLTLDTTATA